MDGKADLFSPPGGSPDVAAGFNNYDNVKLFSILGRLDYRINKSAKAGVYGRWEDYKIGSFVLQGLQSYLPGALPLDSKYGDYPRGHSWSRSDLHLLIRGAREGLDRPSLLQL